MEKTILLCPLCLMTCSLPKLIVQYSKYFEFPQIIGPQLGWLWFAYI